MCIFKKNELEIESYGYVQQESDSKCFRKQCTLSPNCISSSTGGTKIVSVYITYKIALKDFCILTILIYSVCNSVELLIK